MNKFFMEYSSGIGAIGLSVALNSLALNFISILGFVLAFISLHSILMEILRKVAAKSP